jgi:hypothetical protein
MKKLLLILILFATTAGFAQNGPVDRAKGFFIAFAVGPRLPVGGFANSTDLGYGFNVEISYANDGILPLFVFSKIGFDQFPGAQQYYEVTDYSNYSTNTLPFSVGVRYYFRPLVENIVLFMPILEVSANYMYIQTLNQFKPSTGKSNYIDDYSKFGFSVGTGLSMFMMEVLASYNYYYANQYLALELKIRLPLYISL